MYYDYYVVEFVTIKLLVIGDVNIEVGAQSGRRRMPTRTRCAHTDDDA